MRLLVVFGTRPEVVKIAPIIHECRQRVTIECVSCFTGQHRELALQAIEYFDLPVDVDLQVMRSNQSLAALTARCLTGIDDCLLKHEPDFVIAQGDTTTAMAAAVASFYRGRPFVHVEAGLRTGDLFAPWPEEMNRRTAGLVASIHCAPTRWAADNLLSEGIAAESVHVTGNTVVDALLWTLQRERGRAAHWRQKYSMLAERPLVLVTSHRRENFGERLEQICLAIRHAAERLPDAAFLFPVHLNPEVGRTAEQFLRGRKNIHLITPIPYPEFVWLMDRSSVILTDSGGVQEEAPSLGKPVLVMRDATERPEGVQAGVAELVGTSADRISRRVIEVLGEAARLPVQTGQANPYGDGRAARRIVDIVMAASPH